MEQETVTLSKNELSGLIARRLAGAGLAEDQAAVVADILVYAELRGVTSHGALRVEHYVNRIRRGGINTNADFRIEFPKPTMGKMDAAGGMGHVASRRATAAAIDRKSVV